MRPLPPYAIIDNALPGASHDALLDWVLGHAGRFAPAEVVGWRPDAAASVDPRRRVALVTRDFPEIAELLDREMRAVLPRLAAATGLGGDRPERLDLELAAHGDGAHFRAHLDMTIGADRIRLGTTGDDDRVLSAVYYFHRQPKGFAGGELRLFALGSDGGDETGGIDLEPGDNRLVAFPAWALHEVRPVVCPSKRFKDYRFAVNCWYCR